MIKLRQLYNEVKLIPPNCILLKKYNNNNYDYYFESQGEIFIINLSELRSNTIIRRFYNDIRKHIFLDFLDSKKIKYKILKEEDIISVDAKYFITPDPINEVKKLNISVSKDLQQIFYYYEQFYKLWEYLKSIPFLKKNYYQEIEQSKIEHELKSLINIFNTTKIYSIPEFKEYIINTFSEKEIINMKNNIQLKYNVYKPTFNKYKNNLNEVKMLSPYYMKVFNLALHIKSNIVKISNKHEWEEQMNIFHSFFYSYWNINTPTNDNTKSRFGQELKLLSEQQLIKLYNGLKEKFKEFI